RTGMLVDLSGVSAQPLILALALIVVAVIGKLFAGLGVRGKVDKMTVGVGMVPRGEVGLIFADVGRGIRVDGHPLIEPDVYMAVVLMVMGTTVIAPPWLAWQLKRVLAREGGSPKPSAPTPVPNEREGEEPGHAPRADGETTAH
nr:cation:proton antiporter [Myxococcota bacterium]